MQLTEYLARGVDGLAPGWDGRRGELDDPVIGEPTQYGTAYYGLANAALAALRPPGEVELARAGAAARSVLGHLLAPADAPDVSVIDSGLLSWTRASHRDFMWPAVLRTADALRAAERAEAGPLDAMIADVDVPGAFATLPPINWAAVWLSGEQRRIAAGRSPHTGADVDRWLAPFFDERIDLELGLYREPGLPNSYDLFTRVHLQDLPLNGYQGRFIDDLRRLAETGLRRTLGVQLSDGSLASAHRSTAQTWTLGAQLAYLARSSAGEPGLASAIARAHAALGTTLRADGTVSPVQNGLPPSWRIGYERYTADAHYTSLALGFVAAAIAAGADSPPAARLDDRDSAHIEHEPTWRALRHRGAISAHLNLAPHPSYDGFGLVDLTFGAGRRLQFVSSAANPRAEGFVNLGVAVRSADALAPVARRRFDRGRSFTATDDGLRAEAHDEDGRRYAADLALRPGGVAVTEALPGNDEPMSLLVPYPREVGDGAPTAVALAPGGAELAHGAERLRLRVDGPIERVVHAEHGYENRRGLCGLLRIDLAEPREQVRYSIDVEV